MKKILTILLILMIAVSCKRNESSSTETNSSNSMSTSSKASNFSEADHISFVRNHFTSTGNSVYGISVLGKNGANGYIIIVNGYNSKMGVGFDSTVKTNGTNGIQIVDATADYKQY